eukprot:m.205050 g.205050  ORF g.205050 m.205050 type:complete len:88 (+) comp18480_c1_seq6:309-572(+)
MTLMTVRWQGVASQYVTAVALHALATGICVQQFCCSLVVWRCRCNEGALCGSDGYLSMSSLSDRVCRLFFCVFSVGIDHRSSQVSVL